jgi:bifunctional DNA-binding transcriptional regulator/antitoxin component of YhaV-PrlF toxin-antitoxin module
MIESTVTVKGKTTLPAEIRRLIGIKRRTRLVWRALPNGAILVRIKSRPAVDPVATPRPSEAGQNAIEDADRLR